MTSTSESISKRTRTHLSLKEVPIESLEADLYCNPSFLDIEGLETGSQDENPADEDYRQFLISLLPSVEASSSIESISYDPHQHMDCDPDLAFLEEDEEEYVPNDIDVVDDDRKAANALTVSKSELTALLLDSSNMQTTERVKEPPQSAAKASYLPTLRLRKPGTRQYGHVSRLQQLQLLSQMHKHTQLLTQALSLLKQNDLQDPLMAQYQELVKDLEEHGARVKTSTMLRTSCSDIEFNAETRRITRALTAAHTALSHPSMFSIQGLDAPEVRERVMDQVLEQKTGPGPAIHPPGAYIYDMHLLPPMTSPLALAQISTKAIACPKRVTFTVSEDRLLARAVARHEKVIRDNEALQKIQASYLPHRSIKDLGRRTQYLLHPRSVRSHPFYQLYHKLKCGTEVTQAAANTSRQDTWYPEEDRSLLRGVLQHHRSRSMIALIAAYNLPHRRRGPIRNRWKKLKQRFLVAGASDGKVDLSAIEKYLTTLDVASTPAQQHMLPTRLSAQQQNFKDKDKIPSVGADCSTANFHPGLFYGPIAPLEPRCLFQHTCKHNWPCATEIHGYVDAIIPSGEPPVDGEEEDEENDQLTEAISESNENSNRLRTTGAVVTIEEHPDDLCVETLEDNLDDESEFEQEELSSSEEDSDDEDGSFEQEHLEDEDEEDEEDDEQEHLPEVIPWSRDEDRQILLQAKVHGPARASWTDLKSTQPSLYFNRTVEEMEKRYQELRLLIQQHHSRSQT